MWRASSLDMNTATPATSSGSAESPLGTLVRTVSIGAWTCSVRLVAVEPARPHDVAAMLWRKKDRFPEPMTVLSDTSIGPRDARTST